MIRRLLTPWHELDGRGRGVLLLLLFVSCALSLWYALFWADAGRFYDEQFNARNVSALVSGRAPSGMNGFYPAITWAPQAALLWTAERLAPWAGASFVATEGELLSAGGLRLARVTHVVMGVATLFALFLLAGRLFDPATALAAVALLGLSPWHLHASSVFKPDAPLALAWALAALAIADVAVAPTRGGYLGMAATIALAASSKQTGVALAVPAAIVVLTQLRRRDVVRRDLPAAVALGALLLAALNFTQLFFLDDLATIFRFYSGRAKQGSEEPTGAIRALVEWLHDWTTFGAALAVAAVIGALAWSWITIGAARRREPLALARAVTLVTPLAFVSLYLLVTPHFKANNFVPLLQSVALAAALALSRGVAAATAKARLSPRVALLAPWLLAAGARGIVGFDYVYRSVTPTTLDALLAEATRRALLPPHHVVLSEWEDDGELRYERDHEKRFRESIVLITPRLVELAPERRARADAEVWLAAAGRPSGHGASGVSLDSTYQPLRRRGPDLSGLFHAWSEPEEIAGVESKALDTDPWAETEIALRPGLRAGDHVQVVAWLRLYPFDPRSSPRVRFDGGELPMHHGLESGDGDFWASERQLVGAGPGRLRFTFPPDRYRADWAVTVYLWPSPP